MGRAGNFAGARRHEAGAQKPRPSGSRLTLRAWLAIGASIAAGLTALDAQQTPGTPVVAANAFAVIRGVAVDADTGAPVRNAAVWLEHAERRWTLKRTLADNQGRFEFDKVEGGTFTVRASRAGYLPTRLGQEHSDGPGLPIAVADGEVRDDVVIPMSRGGVITGRVVDDYGDPVAGLQVLALQPGAVDGASSMMPVRRSETDDRGTFRLFLLETGQYFVFAQPSALDTFDVTGIAGPIDTYYPNTADAARARLVDVVAGRETSGVNVVLATGRLARLRGRALMSNREPFVGAIVTVQSRRNEPVWSKRAGTVRADGTFELPGVPPGQYRLLAQVGGPAAAKGETGRLDVTVSGENIDNLLIVATRGASVRGLVVTDSGDALPMPAGVISIRLVPAVGDRGANPPPQPINDDFTFELRNLVGRYRLEVESSGMRSLWAPKMIRWNGEDITDRVFDFRDQQLEGVEIVWSDRWGTLSGTVRDVAGAPVRNAPLVLFPVDDALRIPNSRYIRDMRTDGEGRFGVSWLLAGDYYLASPRTMQSGQWNDAAFLQSLAGGAIRVSVAEDDEQVVDLRVGTP